MPKNLMGTNISTHEARAVTSLERPSIQITVSFPDPIPKAVEQDCIYSQWLWWLDKFSQPLKKVINYPLTMLGCVATLWYLILDCSSEHVPLICLHTHVLPSRYLTKHIMPVLDSIIEVTCNFLQLQIQ